MLKMKQVESKSVPAVCNGPAYEAPAGYAPA